MLQVEYHEVPSEAKWLIKQFETFQLNEPYLTELFVPRPDISIIFHFKSTPHLVNTTCTPLEPFFATSVVSKSLEMQMNGPMDTFVVICKPTVFSRFFAIDVSQPNSQCITLPQELFYPVWEDLAHLNTAEERINYFTTFLNSIQTTPYIPDMIDELYDDLIHAGKTTLLKNIMSRFPVTHRTLERRFMKRTGVSPKTLMRIVRLDNVWTPINGSTTIDYQKLVYDGNYCDQAHFIKDFKSVINETPSRFFKRNLQLIKLFSGRSK